VELLKDDALHARITKAGRRRAMEHFSTEMIIPRYEHFYQEVVARG
jgi:L-malate glycosyltransferase